MKKLILMVFFAASIARSEPVVHLFNLWGSKAPSDFPVSDEDAKQKFPAGFRKVLAYLRLAAQP